MARASRRHRQSKLFALKQISETVGQRGEAFSLNCVQTGGNFPCFDLLLSGETNNGETMARVEAARASRKKYGGREFHGCSPETDRELVSAGANEKESERERIILLHRSFRSFLPSDLSTSFILFSPFLLLSQHAGLVRGLGRYLMSIERALFFEPTVYRSRS